MWCSRWKDSNIKCRILFDVITGAVVKKVSKKANRLKQVVLFGSVGIPVATVSMKRWSMSDPEL